MAALVPGEGLDAAGETFRPYADAGFARRDIVLGLDTQGNELGARCAAFADGPQAAIEQGLAPVVAQADELVAGNREFARKAAPLAHARIVGTPRIVAADQHLFGVEDARRIERALV